MKAHLYRLATHFGKTFRQLCQIQYQHVPTEWCISKWLKLIPNCVHFQDIHQHRFYDGHPMYTAYITIVQGIYMESIWNLYGIYMESKWNQYPYEYPMDISQISEGLHRSAPARSHPRSQWSFWLVVWATPLKNMKVNRDDEIPNISGKIKLMATKPPTRFNGVYWIVKLIQVYWDLFRFTALRFIPWPYHESRMLFGLRMRCGFERCSSRNEIWKSRRSVRICPLSSKSALPRVKK